MNWSELSSFERTYLIAIAVLAALIAGFNLWLIWLIWG